MREEPHHLVLLDNHLEVASGLLEKHREALELPEKHQEEDSELQEAALVQEEPLRLELQEKVLEASVLQENRQAALELLGAVLVREEHHHSESS